MPKLTYKTCKRCHRHSDECGPLSHQRLCGECGTYIVAENVAGIVLHEGPAFHRWRRAMAASVGGILVDDLRREA